MNIGSVGRTVGEVLFRGAGAAAVGLVAKNILGGFKPGKPAAVSAVKTGTEVATEKVLEKTNDAVSEDKPILNGVLGAFATPLAVIGSSLFANFLGSKESIPNVLKEEGGLFLGAAPLGALIIGGLMLARKTFAK